MGRHSDLERITAVHSPLFTLIRPQPSTRHQKTNVKAVENERREASPSSLETSSFLGLPSVPRAGTNRNGNTEITTPRQTNQRRTKTIQSTDRMSNPSEITSDQNTHGEG